MTTMSMGSQDIAEARAARMERETMERESEGDVRYELALLGSSTRNNDDIIDAARIKGIHPVTIPTADGDIRVVVSYVPGRFAITRQFKTSQEG